VGSAKRATLTDGASRGAGRDASGGVEATRGAGRGMSGGIGAVRGASNDAKRGV
jgi:hypothetical protein